MLAIFCFPLKIGGSEYHLSRKQLIMVEYAYRTPVVCSKLDRSVAKSKLICALPSLLIFRIRDKPSITRFMTRSTAYRLIRGFKPSEYSMTAAPRRLCNVVISDAIRSFKGRRIVYRKSDKQKIVHQCNLLEEERS